MRVERFRGSLTLPGEYGESLTIRYDNRGEPFRQGINVDLSGGCEGPHVSVWLEGVEARQLRDLLNKMYPPKAG